MFWFWVFSRWHGTGCHGGWAMEKLLLTSAVQQLCSGNLSHMANVLISQCCCYAGPCWYQDLQCYEASRHYNVSSFYFVYRKKFTLYWRKKPIALLNGRCGQMLTLHNIFFWWKLPQTMQFLAPGLCFCKGNRVLKRLWAYSTWVNESLLLRACWFLLAAVCYGFFTLFIYHVANNQ